MNPFAESSDGGALSPQLSSPAAAVEAGSMSVDDVARKLLQESFLLTALELHCELAELGAELPRLSAFFSNPGNFERQTPFKPEIFGQMVRSQSQATLDSVDLARFSEDGERLVDERTALLEFELRKAQETIRSLRADLTGAAELNRSDVGDMSGERAHSEVVTIRPHEKRALNYLLNEYLLEHGYRLTSIAFSDENDDQSLEDWDDVGLNVARPPSLLCLYRGTTPSIVPSAAGCHVACQTTSDTPAVAEAAEDAVFLFSRPHPAALSQAESLDPLCHVYRSVEGGVADASTDQQPAAESISCSRRSPSMTSVAESAVDEAAASPSLEEEEYVVIAGAGAPMTDSVNMTPPLARSVSVTDSVNMTPPLARSVSVTDSVNMTPPLARSVSVTDSVNVTHPVIDSVSVIHRVTDPVSVTAPVTGSVSVTAAVTDRTRATDSVTSAVVAAPGDRASLTEMASSDGSCVIPAAGSSVSGSTSAHPALLAVDTSLLEDNSRLYRENIILRRQLADFSSDGIADCASASLSAGRREDTAQPADSNHHDQSEFCTGARDDAFVRAALVACGCSLPPAAAGDRLGDAAGGDTDVSEDGRLWREVTARCDTGDSALLQLARCLPHVVPNVILAKRQELIPLLLTAIRLHPDAKQRDVLLNMLFNLIKRPDRQQRAIILAGFSTLVSTMATYQIEEEVMPQCWEQISHKYVERRLLVAETCAVLAPIIPPALCGSLVWSMLRQMVADEREPAVRQSALRGFTAVVLLYRHPDKFSQAWQLARTLLVDRSCPVQDTALQLLLPAIVHRALQLDQLRSAVFPDVIAAAHAAAAREPADWSLVVWIQSALVICRFTFVSILSFTADRPDAFTLPETEPVVSDDRLPAGSGSLDDLDVVHGDLQQLRSLTARFDDLTQEADVTRPVNPLLDWFLDECFPALLTLMEAISPVTYDDAVDDAAALFLHIAHMFGPSFTDSHLWPLCESRLSASSDLSSTCPPAGLTSVLLPAVCAGLLAAPRLHSGDGERAALLLQSALYSGGAGSAALSCTVRLLLAPASASSRTADLLLMQLLWKGVMHVEVDVRRVAADISAQLVASVSDETLTSRLLPALVTLASDPQLCVRECVAPSLGLLLERPALPTGLLDKIQLQLSTLSEDRQMGTAMAGVLGRAAVSASGGSRANYYLLRLQQMAARGVPGDAAALLDAFTAVSCTQLPAEVVQQLVVPALSCVVETLSVQGSRQADAAAGLLSDFQRRSAFSPAASHTLPATSSTPPSPSTTDPHQPPLSGSVGGVQQGMDEIRGRVNRLLNSNSVHTKSAQISGFFKKK